MTSNTKFSLSNINVEIDSLTGTKVDTGLVGVEVDPKGNTSVNFLEGESVGVDLTKGTTVDVFDNKVNVDSDKNVKVDVADELVSVDTSEGVASVKASGTTVDLDLSEGVLVGVGEDVLFADLKEGVAIDTDLLSEAGVDIPASSEI
jgi:hypothetical protein